MKSLGIFVIVAGYTLGIFGYSKISSAYGQAPSVSISDLVLPSHRAAYMAAAALWGTPGSSATTPSTGPSATGGTPAFGQPGGTAGPGSGPSTTPPKGTTIITPTTPGGLKGVDLNGGTYTRACSTCPWTPTKTATGQPTGFV